MAETILFVEDSEDDRLMFERALRRLPFKTEVRFANDGHEAISYLEGKDQYSDRQKFPIPTVIFSDVKMPDISGFDLLEWLRNQSPGEFHRIPVVMFSSSDDQQDIDRAYDLGANAYLVKPHAFEQLQKLFRATGEFFLEHAEKPSV